VNNQLEKWVDGICYAVVDGKIKLETGLKQIRTKLTHEGLDATPELLMPILNRIESDASSTGAFAGKNPERRAALAELKQSLIPSGAII
jgi:hypothetical protein